MCGIVGIVGHGAERHREALDRMVASLVHRGPDAQRTHMVPRCGLGHTRLSIVDLETGDQPMLGLDGNTAIVLNGEIYGYREIRDRLASYAFRTRSDTEVILALYERHDVDLLEHLPGMFAFALWDERRGRLFAARDRFGEKPFFYARGPDGELVFASEIRAVLASGLVRPRLSRDSLAHFLRRRFVHPTRTIYENVHTLPPAHRLTFEDGRVEVARYFDLPRTDAMGMDEAADRLRDTLGAAVRRQLVADVPVGAFLSGGLDSSTLVVAAGGRGGGLKTISFGFTGELDERPYAREVAERYGTDHIEVAEIDLDLAAMIEKMAETFDEPLADSATVSTYAVSEEARKHVKVVLTGEGADELMAGYDWWYAPLLDMEREPHPGALRRVILHIAAAAERRLHLGNRAARRLRGIDLRNRHDRVGAAHSHLRQICSDDDLGALDLPVPSRGFLGHAPGTLDDALRADIETYLPGEILVKADRASMAHGLELRAPFLDVDVASLLASLPSSLKLTNNESKAVLRRAYSRDWPESVRRRGKQGFGAPVARWLEDPAVRMLLSRCVDDPASPLHQVLPTAGIRRLRSAGSAPSWSLLVLGLWLERHGGHDTAPAHSA